ncbi:hypothetical protein JDV02_000595 [Purpureocillium takamizusanense]|uniref:Uncharacterized protein n=1 Tax=Purpureocillium takamizusanense TaxID=2060973 RepID=A0A9Q8Q6H4_9HYPO|nr:uncharacterized protein JDV02_000595 [Purpureocillium takamizusanense]UNI13900.1 hypothetical protein JDV02_000595 [Purpureocillium takamizusanense]
MGLADERAVDKSEASEASDDSSTISARPCKATSLGKRAETAEVSNKSDTAAGNAQKDGETSSRWGSDHQHNPGYPDGAEDLLAFVRTLLLQNLTHARNVQHKVVQIQIAIARENARMLSHENLLVELALAWGEHMQSTTTDGRPLTEAQQRLRIEEADPLLYKQTSSRIQELRAASDSLMLATHDDEQYSDILNDIASLLVNFLAPAVRDADCGES